jgi:hypothetical protein
MAMNRSSNAGAPLDPRRLAAAVSKAGVWGTGPTLTAGRTKVEEGLSAVTAEQWEKDETHVKTVEEVLEG